MSAQLPSALTLIFDGNCGICTRIVAWIVEHDREHRITHVPCQRQDVTTRFGVSRKQCEASVWVVTSDDRRVAGAQAAMLVATVVWNKPIFVTAGRWPGVRCILDLGYRLVASNRARLPGITPWCVDHPEECQPPYEAKSDHEG